MYPLRILVFLFNLILFQFVYGDLDELHAKCVSETGIDKGLINNANNGHFSDDRKFKCYLKCVTVAVGVMNDAGEIIATDETIQVFPDYQRDPIKNMVATCGPKIASSDVCEKAYELHNCAYKLDPDKYKLY